MSPQIELTVSQNDKLIQTITKSIEKQQLVKSLEEFQVEANAALTKMIEELGEIDEAIGDADIDDDDGENTDDDTESFQSTGIQSKTPSKSKKKKHH